MLSQLSIQNIAVIQSAQISFENGFNVFTGETGAGKSILIGAIGAVLGARTSKELIRTGETKASVSALFTDISGSVCAKLSEMGFDTENGELLIERDITAESTVCRVNGKLSTVTMLKSIGSLLIHTHGQHDSQLLSDPETHLAFTDSFGRLEPQIEIYKESYQRYCEIKRKLSSLETDEDAKARTIDLLQYQINEIDSASLIDGEEEELISRRRMMRNSEKLSELLNSCRCSLLGDDGQEGAVSQLFSASEDIEKAAEFIDGLDNTAQIVSGFGYELEDIAQQIREQLDMLEYDPQELDDIEDRLDTINKLKKKYGSSIADILSFVQKAKLKLEEIELSDETAQRLREELEAAKNQTVELAAKLTEARKQSAARLIEEVKKELRELDMPAVQMDIEMRAKPLGESGADEAEFLLSVNPGEALKPLSKIASGGEMSRIMLGIKNVLSGREEIATLIFDEIDTGISGRAAQKVGAKLKEAAKERQVICVTHLAQVAVYGKNHLLIEKNVVNGRTFTEILTLDNSGRAAEIARIMNGEPITELALQNARELLSEYSV